jgi:hypothetical protein
MAVESTHLKKKKLKWKGESTANGSRSILKCAFLFALCLVVAPVTFALFHKASFHPG